MEIDEDAFEALCRKYKVTPKNGTADSDVNPIARPFWHEIITFYENAKHSYKHSVCKMCDGEKRVLAESAGNMEIDCPECVGYYPKTRADDE